VSFGCIYIRHADFHTVFPECIAVHNTVLSAADESQSERLRGWYGSELGGNPCGEGQIECGRCYCDTRQETNGYGDQERPRPFPRRDLPQPIKPFAPRERRAHKLGHPLGDLAQRFAGYVPPPCFAPALARVWMRVWKGRLCSGFQPGKPLTNGGAGGIARNMLKACSSSSSLATPRIARFARAQNCLSAILSNKCS
jgi:hypothetical protein